MIIPDYQSPLTRQWREFHALNPHIYRLLVRYSRQLKKAGEKQYSMVGLFEVIRFEHYIKTRTLHSDPFKLNNDYRSYYARLIMAKCKDLDGFFKVRASTADEIDYQYEISQGYL